MGVRLAAAMGNTVTAISTSPRCALLVLGTAIWYYYDNGLSVHSKESVALEIGATSFVVSTSEESMQGAAGSLDLILNTVSAPHQLGHYLPLLVQCSGAVDQWTTLTRKTLFSHVEEF